MKAWFGVRSRPWLKAIIVAHLIALSSLAFLIGFSKHPLISLGVLAFVVHLAYKLSCTVTLRKMRKGEDS